MAREEPTWEPRVPLEISVSGHSPVAGFRPFKAPDGRSRAAWSSRCFGDGSWGPESKPQTPGSDGAPPLDPCAGSQMPCASAAIYLAEMRHEGEVPEGPAFFKGKKRLNYIFKRHRHAEEYQQCLRPEAEMPTMRLWKINMVELGSVALFLGALGSWGGDGNACSLRLAFCCQNGPSR